MAQDRDLFGNFERMRREMDELFGDVFERSGIAGRRRSGFVPPVDVYVEGDGSCAVVEMELAGVDPDQLELAIEDDELVVSGERTPLDAPGRAYQHVEIERGPFRRVVSLGVEVEAEAARAHYEAGLLRIELPLRRRARSRTVPVERGDEASR